METKQEIFHFPCTERFEDHVITETATSNQPVLLKLQAAGNITLL